MDTVIERLYVARSQSLLYTSISASCLKPSNTQFNSMFAVAPVSKDFALNVTFGSLVGEESGVATVRQLVVLGDLLIA